MTDNNQPDDFSHQDHHELGDEPPRAGLVGNVSSAWRTKPLFKLVVIMIVAGALVAVVTSFFSGTKDNMAASHVMTPPDIKGAPGGKDSSFRIKQINEANKEGAEKALQAGGSYIPIPQGTEANNDAKDPLKELRAETEHLKQLIESQQHAQPQAPAPVVRAQPAPQQPEKFDNSLAQAFQHEMTQIVSSDWRIKGSKDIVISKASNSQNASGGSGANGSAEASTPPVRPKTIVAAGTVNYGQLLTEANSDVPGPILAQIVSGPFSGARAVGEFRVVNEYLVLRFRNVNFKGKDYTVDAIALDPDTTLPGMATEVDERYFTRVVLPAAAAFLQGLGSELGSGNTSITTTGTTTIVTQGDQGFRQGMYQGLGAAATTAGQFFRDQANMTKPLVRVAAGTPIGIFFITTVTDQSEQSLNPTTATTPQNPYPVVTNFGGQPMSQNSSSQEDVPYGKGPYGTSVQGRGYGNGGYGSYGGAGYSGTVGTYPGTYYSH